MCWRFPLLLPLAARAAASNSRLRWNNFGPFYDKSAPTHTLASDTCGERERERKGAVKNSVLQLLPPVIKEPGKQKFSFLAVTRTLDMWIWAPDGTAIITFPCSCMGRPARLPRTHTESFTSWGACTRIPWALRALKASPAVKCSRFRAKFDKSLGRTWRVNHVVAKVTQCSTFCKRMQERKKESCCVWKDVPAHQIFCDNGLYLDSITWKLRWAPHFPLTFRRKFLWRGMISWRAHSILHLRLAQR